MKPILITGARGLIGTALRSALAARGVRVVGLDLRSSGAERGDVCDVDSVQRALEGVVGVVHLAAVSRVIAAERDPALCVRTNIDGLRTVVTQMERQVAPPWMVFASSREVYGQPTTLPATETTALSPINIYGRTKVAGEEMIGEARTRGLRAAVVRLSNVYGSTDDYPDRVVPAFARAAITGGQLRVDGGDHTFDFTHLDDTVAALLTLIEILQAGAPPPEPIQILTGEPTTLRELAELAIELAGTPATITDGPRRTFDVSYFHGDPTRAFEVLGWRPRIKVREGLGRLVAAYRKVVTATTT